MRKPVYYSIRISKRGIPLSKLVAKQKKKQKYRGMFETQKSWNKTSPGEIGLNIRTLASPKVGQDQVSEGVSVPCRHATPVSGAQWKPIFSNVKFNKKSNQGKGHESVVSNQGKESNSVRRQVKERVMNWWCNVWYIVSVVSTKEHLQIPNGQDQVSRGVSVPCQHATPVADALWKPIFSNVKFSKSNQEKCHELVLSYQGKRVYSVRS